MPHRKRHVTKPFGLIEPVQPRRCLIPRQAVVLDVERVRVGLGASHERTANASLSVAWLNNHIHQLHVPLIADKKRDADKLGVVTVACREGCERLINTSRPRLFGSVGPSRSGSELQHFGCVDFAIRCECHLISGHGRSYTNPNPRI